jgi:TnpA family transposase
VRELGRVFKTIFILDYLTDPALRRRVRRGLLKGEQLHALARHVHYGKRGQTEGRDWQQQMSRASCLVQIPSDFVVKPCVPRNTLDIATRYPHGVS